MKRLLVTLLIALVAIPFVIPAVQAAPWGPPTNNQNQAPVLTETQKEDIAKIYYQMQDLRKQLLQKYVEAGAMTQEVADARMTLMKSRLDDAVKNGYIGQGMGRGMGGHQGRGGRGMGYGSGWQQQPPVKN